jgi:hypothetical protein
MKKVILEEIENMKYLLGYKRGVVISEQEVEKDDLIDKYSTNSMGKQIDLGNLSGLDPKAAEAIKQFQNMVGGQSVLPNPTAGTPQPATGTPASTTPALGTPPSTPVTPIKIGVNYPSIVELQNLLNTKFQSGLTSDGKYGPKTAASVLSALSKTPTPINTTPTNTTPVNTVVGGDASSEAIKKTAEANASTGVAANTTPSTSAQNAQPATGGTNFTDVDNSEFS